MPLEQEVPNILTICFTTIILIFGLSTIALWIRNKGNSTAYSLVSLHLLLLSTAFYFFMNAITLDYKHPMASEENSLQISIATVFWALSMFSLLAAIFKFSSSSRKSKQT